MSIQSSDPGVTVAAATWDFISFLLLAITLNPETIKPWQHINPQTTALRPQAASYRASVYYTGTWNRESRAIYYIGTWTLSVDVF